MVCYARPASWLVAIVTVAWLVFAGPVSHFFGTAAALAAVLTATAGAAVAAALAFTTFMSVRHRRAAAGGCVNCRFQCQHAMTGPALARTGRAHRFWLVTTADRGPQAHPGRSGRPGNAPGRSVPVLLPMPAMRSGDPGTPGGAMPRWPDRPLLQAGQKGCPDVRVPQRERAGSPALAAAAGIPAS